MKRRLNVPVPHRRGVLAGFAGLFGAASLGGCDKFAETARGVQTLKLGEDANMYVQRLALTPASLAREFPEADISKWFKPNGTTDPEDKPYKALAAKGFETFQLRIDGLVEHPQTLSLADLRALPSRTQITRHDCVEGWSAIGKWTGVPLSELLKKAGLKPQARYIVFHCADTMELAPGGDTDEEAANESAPTDAKAESDGGSASADASSADTGAKMTGGADAKAKTADPKKAAATDETPSDASGGRPIRYYESIDLTDAFHPQTIVAYDMNGKPLPVSNGAPLRLRVERQLGYKQAKYIMRIEVADSLAKFGQGNGGYWEDNGYEWYAGI